MNDNDLVGKIFYDGKTLMQVVASCFPRDYWAHACNESERTARHLYSEEFVVAHLQETA